MMNEEEKNRQLLLNLVSLSTKLPDQQGRLVMAAADRITEIEGHKAELRRQNDHLSTKTLRLLAELKAAGQAGPPKPSNQF